MHNVSKSWRSSVDTAPLCIEGPVNGDTLSFYTMSKYGPVFMPFVTTINLSFCGLVPTNLLDCLLALKLFSFKKRKLTLHVSSNVLAIDQIKTFLKTIHWHYVSASDTVELDITTTNAQLSSQSWSLSTLHGLKKLSLIDMFKNEDLSISCTKKAFETPGLESLELFGLLTDEAMLNLPVSYSLKNIELHHQGICTWTNVQSLQLASPNIESFSILSSNLLKEHLSLFQWAYWPYLKTLNLENNYTLNSGQIYWPPSLKELFVAYTLITGPSCLPIGLSKISCSMDLNDAWYLYLKKNQLTSISATMRHYIKDSNMEIQFWSGIYKSGHLERLSIHHLEFFQQDIHMNAIRSHIKNIPVLKRRPTDWPC